MSTIKQVLLNELFYVELNRKFESVRVLRTQYYIFKS